MQRAASLGLIGTLGAFLLAAYLFTAGGGFAAVHAKTAVDSTSTPAKQPPNILLIYSDDHAYQAVSAYGDARRLLNTPNIDRLAREGMRFDRCLVTSSLCGPARAAVLTGKYAHLNGFYNNEGSKFDGSQLTYPKVLQQAGYQTAYIGKWHLETEPTGFDHYEILHGQGVYFNPRFIVDGKDTATTGYVTDLVRDKTIDWLEHRDKSKPFMLVCANKAPHRPWQPSPDELDFDHDRQYAPPSTLEDDYSGRGIAEHEQKMEIAKNLDDEDLKFKSPPGLSPDQAAKWNAYYQPRNADFRSKKLSGNDLLVWKYNRYLHDYLACAKSVDDSVGTILKYLDDHDLAKNTLVIYSSDQGFFLGEHGWFDKRWIFEQSLRTPFIVRWPEVIKPGSVNTDIVSNLDFAETFIDAAGAQVPAEMQGHSLLPLFRGKTPPDWRTAFYYHYYEYPIWHHVRPHYGIVTDRYKLVHFYRDADYWELFDLQKDPNEMLSVYGKSEYSDVTADLKKRLHALEVELKVPAKDPPGATGKSEVPDAGDWD